MRVTTDFRISGRGNLTVLAPVAYPACRRTCRNNKGNRGSYMTKQLEEALVAEQQQIARDAAEAAASAKNPPSVKMKITSVQYSGAIATPKGDVPSWRITFLLDAPQLLATSLTVQATGANDVVEARESGLNILRRLAQDLLDAAVVFHA
jgi:hypothetical protein